MSNRHNDKWFDSKPEALELRIKELEAERDRLKAEMAYDAEHIESLRAERGRLASSLDSIRLALDDQYGPDAWSIDRILSRVGK